MMAVDDLSCKEFVEIVTEYLEGKLPSHAKMRIETHLVQCDGCATYLEQMQQTIQLVGKLSEDEVPEAAKTRLLQAFRTWKEGLDEPE
jgi:anti-sigma factor RsiW